MQELLGTGLAKIIAVVGTVAALVMGYQYISNNAVDTTIAQINQIHAGMIRLYSNDAGGFTNAAITDADLINNGVIPDNMASGTTINNEFGGDVTITGATTSYTLDMDGIDRQQCVDLMTKFPSGGGVTEIASAANMAGLGAATDRAVPVSVAQATTDCAAATAIRFTLQ